MSERGRGQKGVQHPAATSPTVQGKVASLSQGFNLCGYEMHQPTSHPRPDCNHVNRRAPASRPAQSFISPRKGKWRYHAATVAKSVNLQSATEVHLPGIDIRWGKLSKISLPPASWFSSDFHTFSVAQTFYFLEFSSLSKCSYSTCHVVRNMDTILGHFDHMLSLVSMSRF